MESLRWHPYKGEHTHTHIRGDIGKYVSQPEMESETSVEQTKTTNKREKEVEEGAGAEGERIEEKLKRGCACKLKKVK